MCFLLQYAAAGRIAVGSAAPAHAVDDVLYARIANTAFKRARMWFWRHRGNDFDTAERFEMYKRVHAAAL